MNAFIRLLLIAAAIAATALAGLYFFQSDATVETGSSKTLPGEGAAVAQSEPPQETNPFGVFIGPASNAGTIGELNELCGFDEELRAGQSLFSSSSRNGSVSVYKADQGQNYVLRRFEPETGPVLAFESYGELILQTAHQDRNGFYGRVWTLDETGEPTFSEPLLERGRIPLECSDAKAAASWINENAEKAGLALDPVRSGVRAFAIGDGVMSWHHPSVEGLVEACTPSQSLAELPAGTSILLEAVFDEGATYGEEIYHDMSGESLGGTAEPMVYLTLAQIDEAAQMASIDKVRLPVSWTELLAQDDNFAAVFPFGAIELVSFTVNPDGSRSHSMGGEGTESVSIPCSDPEVAVALLKAVRSEAYQ